MTIDAPVTMARELLMTDDVVVGKGQAPLCGQQLAKPAASAAHKIQQPSRSASRSKLRWVSMRQPHTATGRISITAPRPRICINRSAPIAPG